jgi:chromosomal replication initiator protein
MQNNFFIETNMEQEAQEVFEEGVLEGAAFEYATDYEQTSDQQQAWQFIQADLRKGVGEDAYRRWFEGSEWHQGPEEFVYVMVPGEMHQVWIEANFIPQVQTAVIRHMPDARGVRIEVNERQTASHSNQSDGHEKRNPNHTTTHHREEPLSEKRVKSAGLNPAYTFDSFVVGGNSQFAHAACEAVTRKTGIGYNPLFIHGGPGLGKTHLMQAIGQEILKRRPGARVVYLTCEKFTNEFIDSIRRGDLEKFRRRYRSSDVLLIDDVQFLAGKERSQEEFFHTFNTLMDGQCQVVLSCDRPASEIKNLEPRLISRFECGLTVELQPPQMETRLAILHQKAKAWKVKLDEDVFRYLAEKIQSNVRRLEGALMRVATYASLAGESVHVDKIEHLLRDLIREESSRQVTIDTIQKAVAEYYDVRLADMTSRRRPASIAFPRQVAMYLSRSMTKGSLMEIGEAFGGRDHGTVIHACRKVTERLGLEPELKDAISRIEGILRR